MPHNDPEIKVRDDLNAARNHLSEAYYTLRENGYSHIAASAQLLDAMTQELSDTALDFDSDRKAADR
jgi:hypothetical protein